MHPTISHGSRVALLLWLMSLSVTLQAQPLTEAQVRGTLGAIGELQATFGSQGSGDESPVDLSAYTGTEEELARALAILGKHGFSTLEQWSDIAQRVVAAYMTVKFEGQAPELQRELQRAQAEVESSTDLTPEQKRQMVEMMRQSLAAMQAYANAPPGDVAMVRRLLPELDAAFGE